MQIQFLLQKAVMEDITSLSRNVCYLSKEKIIVSLSYISYNITFMFGNLSLCTIGVFPPENKRCNAVCEIWC